MRTLKEATDTVVHEWDNDSLPSQLHSHARERIKQEWPTLAKSLDNLLEAYIQHYNNSAAEEERFTPPYIRS